MTSAEDNVRRYWAQMPYKQYSSQHLINELISASMGAASDAEVLFDVDEDLDPGQWQVSVLDNAEQGHVFETKIIISVPPADVRSVE